MLFSVVSCFAAVVVIRFTAEMAKNGVYQREWAGGRSRVATYIQPATSTPRHTTPCHCALFAEYFGVTVVLYIYIFLLFFFFCVFCSFSAMFFVRLVTNCFVCVCVRYLFFHFHSTYTSLKLTSLNCKKIAYTAIPIKMDGFSIVTCVIVI